MSWSKTLTACSNCHSDERKHAGHGLCTIFYRLTKKLEMVRKWNLNGRASLKSYPFINEREINPIIFNRLKPNVILIRKILQLGEANIPNEARWWPQRRVDATEVSQDGSAG
jgi:hypothetical protein